MANRSKSSALTSSNAWLPLYSNSNKRATCGTPEGHLQATCGTPALSCPWDRERWTLWNLSMEPSSMDSSSPSHHREAATHVPVSWYCTEVLPLIGWSGSHMFRLLWGVLIPIIIIVVVLVYWIVKMCKNVFSRFILVFCTRSSRGPSWLTLISHDKSCRKSNSRGN